MILSILSDLLKCTQPGIQAAGEKVKCITLCEILVFKETEIIVSPFPRRQSVLKILPLTGFGLLRREPDGGTRGNCRAKSLEGTVDR